MNVDTFGVSKKQNIVRMLNAKMIGEKIAKARKKINISQAELAQRLFISSQAVGKWERGESMPDITTFNSLAEILGVDLNYFSENFPSTVAETAVKMPAGNIDGAETTQELHLPGPERQLVTDFVAGNLAQSDFAGVTAHKSKFDASSLSGSDFSGADLAGSSFKVSNMREARFDGANLTDCLFSVNDMAGASFSKTVLVRTGFNKTGLDGATFTDVTFTGVKLTMIDLRKTVFEKCTFNNVDFKYCDLRGLCLDGLTFAGVKFDKAALNEVSFKGAILKNVSFIPTFALTNRYYRAIKTIRFDGATMDKLTYAALKGMGADLSKVIII